MKYPFTKMQGIGNDFVVFDTFDGTLSLSTKQIQHIADRHFGIGCDQVLLLEPIAAQDIDVRYRIFNADGSEVMQCGNGARCVALYLKQKGLVNSSEIVARVGNEERLILHIDDKDQVTIDMGVPIFEPAQIPLRAPEILQQYQIKLRDRTIIFSAVYLGNPHAVIIVDDVTLAQVDEIGMAMQQSDLFPDSVNVGFMQILDEHTFKLRVYERGVGETLACGSGACAAMVIACQQGYLRSMANAELTGGGLQLRWGGVGESVYMTGPATTVFEGEIQL